MPIEQTVRAELLGGPFDGLSIDVKTEEIEVRRTVKSGRNTAVYERIKPDQFRFRKYVPVPGTDQIHK